MFIIFKKENDTLSKLKECNNYDDVVDTCKNINDDNIFIREYRVCGIKTYSIDKQIKKFLYT